MFCIEMNPKGLYSQIAASKNWIQSSDIGKFCFKNFLTLSTTHRRLKMSVTNGFLKKVSCICKIDDIYLETARSSLCSKKSELEGINPSSNSPSPVYIVNAPYHFVFAISQIFIFWIKSVLMHKSTFSNKHLKSRKFHVNTLYISSYS